MKTIFILRLCGFLTSLCILLALPLGVVYAQPTGCPSATITSVSTPVDCSSVASSASPQTTSVSINTPVLTGNATTYDGLLVDIRQYTTVNSNASTVGVASGSSVTNAGTLNAGALNNAYGISFGANGRSGNGGNIVINTATGVINTTGPNADGIAVITALASSTGNQITNAGAINTIGKNSYGISLDSKTTIPGELNTISNTGVIRTTGANADGIYVKNVRNNTTITNGVGGSIVVAGSGSIGINVVSGAASVINSGVINAGSGLALSFGGTLPANSNNALTINNGSSITGGIAFNKSGTGETMTFNGYSNTGFSNAITGLNVINATNSSNVVMSRISGYELVSGKVAVDGTSSLAISGVIKDQVSPSAVASSIEKNGVGTLVLSGANTYTGGTVLNAGTIAVANNAALGTGSFAMANSTTLQANASVNLANNVGLTGNSTINTNGNNMGLSGNMTGNGGFAKTGEGTLTLSGANSYSGGTTISAGTLAGTTSSIQGNVVNNAIVNFSQSTNGAYAGVMSGSGSVVKDGSGAVTISNTNTYTGDTSINAGSLILTGSTTSNASIAAGANLQGSGVINGNVINSGSITPSFNGAPTNLTVNGNYIGNSGNFVGGVYAPVASPVADTLTVSGNTSGSTGLTITDKGGLGNRTTGNGIPVVIVNGTSTASAFALNQRVAAGAYEYKLYKGGASGAGNSWYLSTQAPTPASTPSPDSSAPAPVTPPAPVITPAAGERIEVAVYPAVPSLVQLYAQTAVDTLDQRRGDLNLVDPQGGAKKSSNDWARIIGKTGTSTPSSVSEGPKMNFNAYALQLGVDVYQNEEQGGSRSYVGPYVTIGSANANTSSQSGGISTGSINGMQAYSLGLYGTHFASNGLYVDALAQGTRYLNAGASSVQGAQLRTQGTGFTGSLEGGGRWNVDKFLISPQAQIVYDAIGMNNATDAYGQVNFNKSEMTRGRLGLLAGHKDVIGSTPVFAYLRASYWGIFNAGTSTTMASLYGVNPITFQSQANSRWMTVDAEVNARITKDTNLFLNLAVDNSLVGTYQAYSGRIGLQTRF